MSRVTPQSPRVRQAVLAGVLVVATSTLAQQAPAHAHAVLRASAPVDGATLERAPEEVLLTFTGAVDPDLSVVSLVDATGQPVGAVRAERVPRQRAQLRVPLAPLADGVYTVTWRVTSPADGHTTAGALAFGVRAPAVPAASDAAAVQVRALAVTGLSVAGRWLFYVGVVLMLGAAAVGIAVAAHPRAVSGPLLAAAWATAAAGVLVTMVDQRARAETGLASFLASSTGHRLATQAAAVAFAGAAVVGALRRPSRRALTLVGATASAAMLSRALAGHANASSPRWFTVGTQWVHLVSAGVWVGGLFWLLVAMGRRDPGQCAGLARRFSKVAALTLTVVAVSGGARTLDEVGAWAQLVDTNFGVTLLVKVALFAALVALGAWSHFRHVPGSAAGRAGRLPVVVRAEVVVAAVALGAAALLTGFPPAETVAAASRGPDVPMGLVTRATAPQSPAAGRAPCRSAPADRSYSLTFGSDPDPPRAEGATLHLALRQGERAVTGAQVCVRVDMPDMQHPGVTAMATERSPGQYDARLKFSMTGTWSGSVVVTEPGRQPVSVPIRLAVG